MPIPFAGHLKITTEKAAGFYNTYYQLYKDISLTSWTNNQDNSKLIDIFQRCGSDPKRVTEDIRVTRKVVPLAAAGRGTMPEVELLSLNNGGTIQYIKINPLESPDS